MKRYCTAMYKSMQINLQQCDLSQPCIHKKVEHCFMVVYRHWHQVKEKLIGFRFKTDRQEIEFFKTTKPAFTSEIEYYSLLYHSLLFEPLDHQRRFEFWMREHFRLQNFEDANRDFISCYHDAHCEMIPFYFLRKYYQCNPGDQVKKFDDNAAVTNGDHLAATWLALKKYREYVIQKLPRNSF